MLQYKVITTNGPCGDRLGPIVTEKFGLIGRESNFYLCTSFCIQIVDVGLFKYHKTQHKPLKRIFPFQTSLSNFTLPT